MKDQKEKRAYVFFNCDGEKNRSSMNLFYNREIYRDTKTSRKLLLKKLELEEKEGRIHILDLKAVHDAVLEGKPDDAAQYLQYGTVEAFPII